MPSISVAMATYNGALYLQDQLNSIAAQSAKPAELVVCDDGSSDGTLAILHAFASSSPFPVRIYQNESNLGFANNFLKCASLCSGTWVAFCDQDDIWLPSKLETLGRTISASSSDVVLVYHVASVVSVELEPTGRVLPRVPRARSFGRGEQHAHWFVGGCVMCFRADLLVGFNQDERPRDSYDGNKGWHGHGHPWMPHDKWLCLLANVCGATVALPDVLSLYRRHAAAETGAHANEGFVRPLMHAARTGSSQYEFLAQRARETATFLHAAANRHGDVQRASHLRAGGSSFERVAAQYEVRARLYSACHIQHRWKSFATLLDMRAYTGEPIESLGLRACLKDTARAVGAVWGAYR